MLTSFIFFFALATSFVLLLRTIIKVLNSVNTKLENSLFAELLISLVVSFLWTVYRTMNTLNI